MKPFPPRITRLARYFNKHGYQVYVVGGAVRDALRGLTPSDIDLATDATPQQVMKIFTKTFPTGVDHGTVTVRFEGELFEVTTYRIDGEYMDGRHPQQVQFTSDLEEDLSRRDFTVNAMAFDPVGKKLIDPFDGQQDLKQGLIRTVGDPQLRFQEDSLRVLRAIRFAVKLQVPIESSTWASVQSHGPQLKRVSIERIRDEFSKMITSDQPGRAVALLRDAGLLTYISPALLSCAEHFFTQGNPPGKQYSLLDHLIFSLEHIGSKDLYLRLAALFHDVGKPDVYDIDNGAPYMGHEKVSAQLAHRDLSALRYPNKVRDRVSHLIEHHGFTASQLSSDKALRRFIHRVGPNDVGGILALRMADRKPWQQQLSNHGDMISLSHRIKQELSKRSVPSLKELPVSGKDIMVQLGIKPGPIIGTLLNRAHEAVLDDPEMNDKSKLMNFIEKLYYSVPRDGELD